MVSVAASVRRVASFWVIATANLVYLAVAPLDFDSTRVFTLLSWPRVLTLVALLALLVPRVSL